MSAFCLPATGDLSSARDRPFRPFAREGSRLGTIRADLFFGSTYGLALAAGEVMGGAVGVHFHHQGDEIVFGEETVTHDTVSGRLANMLSEARNHDAQSD